MNSHNNYFSVVKKYAGSIAMLGILISIVSQFFQFPPTSSINTNDKVDISENTQINQVFEQLRSAGWDLSEPLVWGYYFYDNDQENLELFRHVLANNELEVYPIRNGMSDDYNFLLYGHETKIYNPDLLLKRSQDLRELANENQIELYDGWEVGTEPL